MTLTPLFCVKCGHKFQTEEGIMASKCPNCGSKKAKMDYMNEPRNTPPQKGKCPRCGGALHWYNSQIPNPDGEGELCEKCSKPLRKEYIEGIKNREKERKSIINSVQAIHVSESMIQSLTSQYIMVNDFTERGYTLKNLMFAINLFAQNGWVLESFSTNADAGGGTNAWVIMKKV